MENEFGERLKGLRQEKEIGQIELAKNLGVSKGVISLWENGLREPNIHRKVFRRNNRLSCGNSGLKKAGGRELFRPLVLYIFLSKYRDRDSAVD